MDSLMSNIWLGLYIIAWIVTFITYQKKKQYFDAGSVLLCSYLLYSIASLLLFNNPYLGSKYKSLHLFPFIYMYLMLMLASSPVLKYDVLKINKIQKPRNVIFYSVCIIFILSSTARVPVELPNYLEGFMRIMLDTYGGAEIYNETMANSFLNLGDGNISNLPAIISNSLSDIGVLLFFYYLTLEKRNKLISFGLLISCIFPIFGNISNSQRGPVLEQLLTLIITYFAFRKFIQTKINKIIQRVGIILLVATAIPIIAISISRFGGNEGGTLSSIYDYAGMQNLNFNNYGI
jgi:oligosaccharide repeat unit polymerase